MDSKTKYVDVGGIGGCQDNTTVPLTDAIESMIRATGGEVYHINGPGHPRPPWESTRILCDWPKGKFSMRDEADPHGHTWLILPDGQMVDISHHNNPAVNPAQVAWMVDVLNRALAAEDEASNTHNQQRDTTEPGDMRYEGGKK